MSYFDIINTINQYGKGMQSKFANTANNLNNIKFNAGPVNPSSSGAYVTQTPRDIYGRTPDVYNPLEAFQDYKPYSGENLMMQGTQGLQYAGMANKITPMLQSAATSLGAKGTMGSLGPAAALYGMTRNQNPYDWTSTERLGTIGSTAMAAHSLAPVLNPILTKAIPTIAGNAAMGAAGTGILGMHPALAIGSFLLGNMFSKKGKKKANRLKREAIEGAETAQEEGYDNRAEKVADMRNEMLAQRESDMYQQRQGQYSNQYGGGYTAEEGMKFTPKELKKIAKAGRNGDTMLAHITPEESALLQSLGGSGTINPYTGLTEHFGFLRRLRKKIMGGAKKVRKFTDPIVKSVANPVFNTAGNVVNPALRGASKFGAIGGSLGLGALRKSIKASIKAAKAGGDIASGAMKESSKLINPVLKPVMSTAMDIADPIMDKIEDVSTPIMGAAADLAKTGIEGTLDATKTLGFDVLMPLAETILTPLGDAWKAATGMWTDRSDSGAENPYQEAPVDITRSAMERTTSDPLMVGSEKPALSGLIKRRDERKKVMEGDWVGDKPNPFTTPNVEEELDYANKGMKYKYADGGKPNIIAEFTGNELIVNDQGNLEKALSNQNYSKAASYIRKAMKGGKITPGPETHRGNPMPVDSKGNIYAGGGTLPFKVKKGAGIYDHATDQFRPDMTDKEIAMVAKKNIAKWKSNGMA